MAADRELRHRKPPQLGRCTLMGDSRSTCGKGLSDERYRPADAEGDRGRRDPGRYTHYIEEMNR